MVIKELFAKLGFEFNEAQFAAAETALGGIGKGLAVVGAAAVAAGTAFFYEMNKVAQAGFETAKAAQRLGIATDALQELRGAAELVGVEGEALDHGLRHLSRAVFEASQGNFEMSYTLGLVGAKVRDVHGNLLPADQVLNSIADKFSKMPDGMRKTALAMQIFGRSGADMIPMLNRGHAGIAAMREEARKYGIVMDADMIQRSKEFVLEGKHLNMALEGLKLALVGPTVQMRKLIVAVTDWIVANRALIASGFQTFLKSLIWLGQRVADVFTAIGNVFRLIAMVPANLLIMALGSIVLALAFVYAESIATALASAAAWLIAAAPIIAIVAAIALVIAILDDLYVFLMGGKSVIGEYLVPAFHHFFNDLLPKWFHAALQWFKDFFHDMKVWALDEIDDLVKFMIKKLMVPINWIKQHASPSSWFGAAAAGGEPTTAPITAAASGASNPTASAVIGHRVVNAGLTIGDINVTAPGGDPKAIAGEVTRQIEDHHRKVWRNTAAAVGGAR